MKLKLRNILIVLSLIFLSLFVTTDIFLAEVNRKDSRDSNTSESREKPIIIWYHSGNQTSTLPLSTALSSGLITHVMLEYRNPADGPWYAERRVRKAIEMVKKSDAKLIWCRDLWARWVVKDAKFADLFEPQYYIKQIQSLQADAKEMGADFVALDTEPYGNSPMKLYLRGKDRIRLSYGKRRQIKLAVEKVVQKIGKIDFIFPASSTSKDHPWNILSDLGKFRISEHTYYDNEKTIRNLKYPYEIFGFYLKTTKRNDRQPFNPYFLASEIFERSELWSNRKGVFIYTSKAESLAVAKDLVAYSKTLPSLDSTKSSEPNRP